MPSHLGASRAIVDTKDGNHFEVFVVTHDGVSITDIPVPDSCVSAAVLMDDITVAALPLQTTSATGITVVNRTSGANGAGQDWATNDGLKAVSITANQLAGTYYVVARYVGSAAGSGGGTSTDL